MKCLPLALACVALMPWIAPPDTYAQAVPPGVITYQARVTDGADGTLNVPSQELKLLLWSASTGGALILTDEHLGANASSISNSLLTTQIGGGTLVPGTATTIEQAFRDNAEVWLETHLKNSGGTFEVLTPRMRIATAGYSQNAANLSGQPQAFYRNAANLNAGTVADARLSTNVPLLGSAIDLGTAEVTGTLGLANGGTGATAFAAGSVVFSDGTKLSQDTANLFWDDAANKLGLGTATPISRLQVAGGAAIDKIGLGFGEPSPFGTLLCARVNRATDEPIYEAVQLGGGDSTLRFTRGTTISYAVGIDNDSSFKINFSNSDVAELGAGAFLTLNTSGNFGIGTTGPGFPLHVYVDQALANTIGCRIQNANTGSVAVGTERTVSLDLRNTDPATARNYRLQVVGNRGDVRDENFEIYDTTAGAGLRFTINDTGNVGIGNIQPNMPLTVLGDNAVQLQGGAYTSIWMKKTNATAQEYQIFNDGTWVVRDITAGSADRLRIWTDGAFQIYNSFAGKPGGGSWVDTSDRRLKKEIKPLEGSLDRLLRLRGVTYEWQEPEKHGNLTGPQTGMIAQEVEEVFPEWVRTGPDGYKTLGFRGFEALTVEALRELRAKHEAEIAALRAENAELAKKLAAQDARLVVLEGRHPRVARTDEAASPDAGER